MAFKGSLAKTLLTAVGAIITGTGSSIDAATADTAFAKVVAVKTTVVKVGRAIRLKIVGTITSSGTPPTVTLKIKYGTTTIFTSGAITVRASQNAVVFVAEIDIHVAAVGATGSFVTQASIRSAAIDTVSELLIAPAATTVNTTADANLSIVVASSAATASNSVALKTVTPELLV